VKRKGRAKFVHVLIFMNCSLPAKGDSGDEGGVLLQFKTNMGDAAVF
jgi:hypothetical protein